MPQRKKTTIKRSKAPTRTVRIIRQEIVGLEREIGQIRRRCRHKYRFLHWQKGGSPATDVLGTKLLGSECRGRYERAYIFTVECEKCKMDDRRSSLSTCPKCCSRLVRKRKVDTDRYMFTPSGYPGFKVVLHECENEQCRFRGVTIERDPKYIHDPEVPF